MPLLAMAVAGVVHAESRFDDINKHAVSAIDALSGKSNDGTMGVALASLADAPWAAANSEVFEFIEQYRKRRGFKSNDMYTFELVQQLAAKDVLLMDPGYRSGPLFQEIVDRRPLASSGLNALRDLFNEPDLEVNPVLYVADARCGQRRLAGLTLGGVATVCGTAIGINREDDPRSHQVAVHEAAHSWVFHRYHRFRGYLGLVPFAERIFDPINVHTTLHVNEFFGLAAEILDGDPTIWEHTLLDLLQTELHLPAYLPDFVASREHQHSVGYALYYNTLRELEAEFGVEGDENIRTLVDEAYEGPLAVDRASIHLRARAYVEANIDERWQRRIADAFRERAHAMVAWLEDNPPDPAIYEGDRLYDLGDGPGAIKAWASVEGPAQAEAFNSVRSVYAWGGRGVEADADLAFDWLYRAIRAGSRSAAITTIHADQNRVLPSLKAIEDAIRLYGEDVDLLIARSQMYERLNMLKEAEQDLEEVKRILFGEPTGLNTLGYFLADRDLRIPDAIKYLEEADELTQGYSPYIMDSLGWAYFRAGRLDEAEDTLREALDQLKDDMAISAHLGEVLWAKGERDEARAVWDRVSRMTPTPNYEERTLRETISRLTAKDG